MRLPLPLSLGKLFGPSVTAAGVVAVVYLAITGRLDLSQLASSVSGLAGSQETVEADAPQVLPAVAPTDTVTVATFNIQRLGEKKSTDPNVMAYLARICASFDLIAIQEAISPDADPVGRLVTQINQTYGAERGRYDMMISNPIGRTSYREQYAFVFNTSRIRPLPGRAYVMDDSQEDRLQREPLVASFQTVLPPNSNQMPFTFTVINAHTDPDEVGPQAAGENELDVLADIFQIVRGYEGELAGEDDFILLGDLNAPRTQFFGLSRIPGLQSLAPPGPTNVRGTKEYDHILIDRSMTEEFTGRAAVISLQSEFQLNEEQALMISDHRPVYAEFQIFEAPRRSPAVAANPNALGR